MSNISVCRSQVIPNVSNLQDGIWDCYKRHIVICHWKSDCLCTFDQQPDGGFYRIYLIWNIHSNYTGPLIFSVLVAVSREGRKWICQMQTSVDVTPVVESGCIAASSADNRSWMLLEMNACCWVPKNTPINPKLHNFIFLWIQKAFRKTMIDLICSKSITNQW